MRLCLGPGTRYPVRRSVHARGRVGTVVHASDAFPPPGHMRPPLHSRPPCTCTCTCTCLHLRFCQFHGIALKPPGYLSLPFRPVCTSWRSSFPMDPIPCHPVFWSQSHFAFPLELERIVAVGAVSSTLLSRLSGLSLALCPPPLHSDLGSFPPPPPTRKPPEHCLVLAPPHCRAHTVSYTVLCSSFSSSYIVREPSPVPVANNFPAMPLGLASIAL